jgi:hypothetical protein
MASVSIDANSIIPFALRWTFAGFWGFFGWKFAQIVYAAIPWP